MRKNLEIVGLVVLAVLCWITWQALYGPDRLPDRVPTHFDAAGTPNGWGPPSTLLLLPIVAVGVYCLITLVALFPSAFNYPVRITLENRLRLQTLSLQMVAWLKFDLACLFTWLQWSILNTVRNGQGRLSPWIVPFFLVVVFGTCIAHIVAMFRTARPTLSS
ncbi:MAG: DUF1648 domain-containing protein [Terracidiphilus sp.]